MARDDFKNLGFRNDDAQVKDPQFPNVSQENESIKKCDGGRPGELRW